MARTCVVFLIFSLFCISNITAASAACKPIRSVPRTIVKKGTYCLKRDLTYSPGNGAAITINVDNVILDFNGFVLKAESLQPDSLAEGVLVESDAHTVVRNGSIYGFGTGIKLVGGNGHLVENMLVDRSNIYGMLASNTESLTIRRNRITRTGGTSENSSTGGIYISIGTESRIVGNDVSDTVRNTVGTERAYGIRIMSNASIAENNRVTNSADYGIYFSNNFNVVAANNRVINYPDDGAIGMRFNGTTGVYKDNIVGGFTIAFQFGVDGGGNTELP
jgi:hypothetical protein